MDCQSPSFTLCDKKGPTLCIIKSGDYLFGGYNPNQWDSPEKPIEKHLPSSFIFTLSNPHGIPPAQYWPQNDTPSITQNESEGPIFGNGNYGLYVFGNFKFVWIGPLTGGFIDTTGKDQETFTGQWNNNPIDAIFVYFPLDSFFLSVIIHLSLV